MTPPQPAPGQTFRVDVTIHNRKLDDTVAMWLDDTRSGVFTLPPEYQPASCSDSGLRSTDETLTFTTAYRATGVHHAPLAVRGCGPTPDPEIDLTVDIDVEGPPPPTNGPQLPVFDFVESAPNGPTGAWSDQFQTHLNVEAGDADGLVSEFVVDWGDGTAPDHVSAPTTDDMKASVCDTTHETGGSSSQVWPGHTFATSGSHTVTVTVISTGCNGDPPQQQATRTIDL